MKDLPHALTLEQLIRERSREYCPDYPNIQQDLDPWEHMWALCSTIEGTRLANDDCHKFIRWLITKLNEHMGLQMSYMEILGWYESQKGEANDHPRIA